jgi:antirestriction protein
MLGEHIKLIQQKLIELGHQYGEACEEWTAHAQEAMKSYLMSKGINWPHYTQLPTEIEHLYPELRDYITNIIGVVVADAEKVEEKVEGELKTINEELTGEKNTVEGELQTDEDKVDSLLEKAEDKVEGGTDESEQPAPSSSDTPAVDSNADGVIVNEEKPSTGN